MAIRSRAKVSSAQARTSWGSWSSYSTDSSPASHSSRTTRWSRFSGAAMAISGNAPYCGGLGARDADQLFVGLAFGETLEGLAVGALGEVGRDQALDGFRGGLGRDATQKRPADLGFSAGAAQAAAQVDLVGLQLARIGIA